MYCSKCGKNSPYSSNFCNYCGAEFLDKKMSSKSYENYYKPKKYIDWQTPLFLFSCVLIIVLLFVFIIPSIKDFIGTRFQTSTHVYATVERSYKSKCIDGTNKSLANGKGNKKDTFYIVSGKVMSVSYGDNNCIFEVNVTRNENGEYTDTYYILYNDITKKIDEGDIVVFWGKDNCSGETRDSYTDADPRISAEYASSVNSMAIG